MRKYTWNFTNETQKRVRICFDDGTTACLTYRLFIKRFKHFGQKKCVRSKLGRRHHNEIRNN